MAMLNNQRLYEITSPPKTCCIYFRLVIYIKHLSQTLKHIKKIRKWDLMDTQKRLRCCTQDLNESEHGVYTKLWPDRLISRAIMGMAQNNVTGSKHFWSF